MFYRALFAFVCSGLLSASVLGEEPSAKDPRFEVIGTDYPVSDLAMSEDGRRLIVLHCQSNVVSIVDTETGAILKELRCYRPGAALCRGGKLYVGSYRNPCLGVYSLESGEILDKIPVGGGNILSLTAPQGEHFKGMMLARCRPQTMGFLPATVYLIDTVHGTAQLVNEIQTPSFLVDDTGKFLVQLDSKFSSICDYEDYLQGKPERSLKTAMKATESIRAILRQLGTSSYWLGVTQRTEHEPDFLYSGLPPVKSGEIRGDVIVPDQRGTYLYAFGQDQLSVIRPELSLEPIVRQKVTLPDDLKKADSITNYHCHSDQVPVPYAVLLHGDLHLFALKEIQSYEGESKVYHAVFRNLFKPETSGSTLPVKVVVGERLACRISAETIRNATMLNGPEEASVSADGVLAWTPRQPGIGQFKVRAAVGEKTVFLRFIIEAVAKAPGTPPAP